MKNKVALITPFEVIVKCVSILLLVIVSVSCKNNKSDASTQQSDSLAIKTSNALPTEINVSDTFLVDEFLVTDKMIETVSNKNLDFKIQSGDFAALDKVWFKNTKLNQSLVLELYTDYFRYKYFLFDNTTVPTDVFMNMGIQNQKGEPISIVKNLKEVKDFLNKANEIESNYFTSTKGFAIGDVKHKAITSYGQPDTTSTIDDISKLEWSFLGSEFIDENSPLKNKPIAKNSFGYKVIGYYKNDKMVALVIFNEIP